MDRSVGSREKRADRGEVPASATAATAAATVDWPVKYYSGDVPPPPPRYYLLKTSGRIDVAAVRIEAVMATDGRAARLSHFPLNFLGRVRPVIFVRD